MMVTIDTVTVMGLNAFAMAFLALGVFAAYLHEDFWVGIVAVLFAIFVLIRI